jgi:hypothetical protein
MNQRIFELSMAEAKDVMEKLADQSAGKLPADWMIFHKALTNEAKNPSFWKAIKFVSYESAKDIATETANIGAGIINTVRLSKYAIPVLVIGGAAFLVYRFTRKVTN